MTDQSPNDQFRASSFVQGQNTGYIQPLFARFASDLALVDEAGRLVAGFRNDAFCKDTFYKGVGTGSVTPASWCKF